MPELGRQAGQPESGGRMKDGVSNQKPRAEVWGRKSTSFKTEGEVNSLK